MSPRGLIATGLVFQWFLLLMFAAGAGLEEMDEPGTEILLAATTLAITIGWLRELRRRGELDDGMALKDDPMDTPENRKD
jgi:hypothetical protein